MSNLTKVAVVTGSNKGIGYAIVKGLCEKYNGTVYLTARDVPRGTAAVNKLKKLGFNPQFHQLDITDNKSISTFVDYLKTTHGSIDVLVNNAAIAFNPGATESFSEQAEVATRVNYFSTLNVCDAFFPILKNGARIINISSSTGHLSRIPSPEFRAKFSNPNLTIPVLNELVDQFVDAVKRGKSSEEGWGNSPYSYLVSKVAVTAMTRIHQREHPNLLINSVHPGYVDTDMTSHKGVLTIEQGAIAPLYLALEDHNLKGQYLWCDAKVVDWTSESAP